MCLPGTYRLKKELGKGIAIFEMPDGQSIIVKTPPANPSLLTRLSRFLGKGGMRLQNEQTVYDAITAKGTPIVCAPTVIDSIPGRYLALSHLQGDNTGHKRLDAPAVLREVISLNALTLNYNSHIIRLHTWLRFSPGIFSARRIFRGTQGFLPFLDRLLLASHALRLYYCLPKTSKRILLHNDMNADNIIGINGTPLSDRL